MNSPDKTNKPTAATYHKSVLVKEVLHYLDPKPNKTYVDVTFGGGGHTRAILEHEPLCKVIALDWDKNAIKMNEPALKEEFGDRIKVLWGNFALLYKILKKEKIKQVDGILADFGTSQFQIHSKEGFSFQTDTRLDMRMSSACHQMIAADIINRYSEKDLATLFFTYGEETQSRRIAKAIVAERQIKEIRTTQDLVSVILKVMPWGKQRIHPATKVFQALRIEVNHELENISAFLTASLHFLAPQGRLVCISFHSLEDRIVKSFIRDHSAELEKLTTKPVMASPEEASLNPSSRSAKLRAAEKIG